MGAIWFRTNHISLFPCQSVLVLQTLMSFWHWIWLHLELCFQRSPSLFWFQAYQLLQMFSFCCFRCSSFSFFLMSRFLLISLALSRNLKAFFNYPCSISLQKAFWLYCFLVLNDFFSLVWIASHSEISSSRFPCFHHSIPLFKYLTCSLFFYLSDGFWSRSSRNTWSMWIATGSHLLLPLKSPNKTRHFCS